MADGAGVDFGRAQYDIIPERSFGVQAGGDYIAADAKFDFGGEAVGEAAPAVAAEVDSLVEQGPLGDGDNYSESQSSDELGDSGEEDDPDNLGEEGAGGDEGNAGDDVEGGRELDFLATVDQNEIKKAVADSTKRANSKRTRNIIAAIVITVVVISVSLIWALLFSDQRKNGANGLLGKRLRKVGDKVTDSVDFDILAENGGPILVDAVNLVDHDDSHGSWGVDPATKHIAFTPATDSSIAGKTPPVPGTVVRATYVLVGVGWPTQQESAPADLVVVYKPVAVNLPKMATDRTSNVVFDVLKSNGNFTGIISPLGSLTPKEGTWIVDNTMGTVTFRPLQPLTTPSVNLSYALTVPGDFAGDDSISSDPAQLTIVFPALPGAPTAKSISKTASDRTSLVDIDVPHENAVNGVDFAGTVALVSMDNTGTWMAPGHITFKPTQPFSANSAHATYTLTNSSGTSLPADIFINFPPILPGAPTAKSISKTASDRTSLVDIDVPHENAVNGVDFAGTVALVSMDNTGTWMAPGHITFKPTQPFSANSAHATYTLTSASGTSAPADIFINFPPIAVQKPGTPVEPPQTGVNRLTKTTFNIPADNPGLLQTGDLVKIDAGAGGLVASQHTSAGLWAVQLNNSVLFTPDAPCTPPSDAVQIRVVRGTLNSDPCTLSITFSTDPVAYPVVGVPAASPLVGISNFDCDFSKLIVAPNGYDHILFFKDMDPATVGGTAYIDTSSTNGTATWTVPVFSTQTARCALSGTLAQATVYYAVVDTQGKTSNRAQMQVMLMMLSPVARHSLLAQDVTKGQKVTLDVMASGTSFHAKDLKSVELLGIHDTGGEYAAAKGYVRKDGKALRVPNEGTWLVGDDGGLVAFQADAGLAHAPTPVRFRFADEKGNKSNAAVIVVDPLLSQISVLMKGIAKMSDADFWKAFSENAIEGPAKSKAGALEADELLIIVETYAAATQPLLPFTGVANPISKADFDASYQVWVEAGQPIVDAQKPSNGVYQICMALGDKLLKGVTAPFAARFLRLKLISLMLTQYIAELPADS